MADWQADITPDGQRKQKLNFFARDDKQARIFLEQHMSFVGGEIHQIRRVGPELEIDDWDEDNPKPRPRARRTLGGY